MNLKKLFLGSVVLLMFSASIVVFNISCNKESDAQPPTSCNEPAATFKYKWNGTLYEMNGSLTQNAREGSLIRKEQTTKNGASNPFDNANGDPLNNTKYLYSILATKNYYYSDDGEPILEIELRTNNLSTSRTFSSANNEIKLVYFYYPLQAGGQQFNVNFTKIVNGYADGTFNGTVISSNNQTIQITEGEFKNVRILE